MNSLLTKRIAASGNEIGKKTNRLAHAQLVQKAEVPHRFVVISSSFLAVALAKQIWRMSIGGCGGKG